MKILKIATTIIVILFLLVLLGLLFAPLLNGDEISFFVETSKREDIHKEFTINEGEDQRVFDREHSVTRFVVELEHKPFLVYLGTGAITKKTGFLNGEKVKVEGSQGFLWGYGLIQEYNLQETLRLCFKGRHIEHYDGNLRAEEWFIISYLEKDLSDRVTCYGGVSYFDEDNTFDGEIPGYGNVHWFTGEANTYGALAGLKFNTCMNMSWMIEGRFVNQQSVIFGCSFEF